MTELSIADHGEISQDVDSTTFVALRQVFFELMLARFNERLFDKKWGVHAEIKKINTKLYAGYRYLDLWDGAIMVSGKVPNDLAERLTTGDAGRWIGYFELPSKDKQWTYESLTFVVTRFLPDRGDLRLLESPRKAERDKMEQEGVFTRSVRTFPGLEKGWLQVVIVSSESAQGHQDVMELLKSHPLIRTQTEACNLQVPRDIASAIQRAERQSADVLLVARGGGNLEAFDHPDVVRALATCNTYTVTGLGHTNDHPLVEEVADHAAATPSTAGKFLLEKVETWEYEQSRLSEEERVQAAKDELAKAMNDTFALQLQQIEENRKAELVQQKVQWERQTAQITKALQYAEQENKRLQETVARLRQSTSMQSKVPAGKTSNWAKWWIIVTGLVIFLLLVMGLNVR